MSVRWTAEQLKANKAKSAAPEKKGLVPRKTKAVRIPETKIQQSVVQWFKERYSDIYETGAFFAVPNEGKRSIATASRMRAEGMVSGVSDLILLVPKGGFHGLCIEMKAIGGKLTDKQRDWLKHRAKSGYMTAVCYSLDDAMSVIDTYFSLKS